MRAEPRLTWTNERREPCLQSKVSAVLVFLQPQLSRSKLQTPFTTLAVAGTASHSPS